MRPVASARSQRPSTSGSGTSFHISLPPPPTFGGGASPGRSNPTTPISPGAQLGSPSAATSPRSSFLPSFMQRSRPRASTLTRGMRDAAQPSPSTERPDPMTPSGRGGAMSTDPAGNVLGRSISQPMTSSGRVGVNGSSAMEGLGLSNVTSYPAPDASTSSSLQPTTTFRIRLVPHLENITSLRFDPVVRDLHPAPTGGKPSKPDGMIVKIGRFTEKMNTNTVGGGTNTDLQGSAGPLTAAIPGDITTNPFASGWPSDNVTSSQSQSQVVSRQPPPVPVVGRGAGGGGSTTSGKVAFKSKVVSRGHAEIWCESDGKFFIRDTKSSSGTFLNHFRLSPASQESKPFALKDGDVIQLGIDYQGGAEEMYRCVKMKVEVGRQWGKVADKFNLQSMKQLQILSGLPESPVASSTASIKEKKTNKNHMFECCICLFWVVAQQATFVAPCGHLFHYKCIRSMLNNHHPGFSCPLCRVFHDLDADVDTEDAWETASRRQSAVRRNSGGIPDSPAEPVPLIIEGPTSHSELIRLTTAVQDDDEDSRAGTPVVPAAIAEEDAVSTTIGSVLIPLRANGSTETDDNHTPINDTYLSTVTTNLQQTLHIGGRPHSDLGSPPNEELELTTRNGITDQHVESGGLGQQVDEMLF